jgi:hypothetical protein
MSKQNDFMPTRSAAHEYSERSIQHSREFMSHPEAIQALGELAPRVVDILDYLYIPDTTIDANGNLVVELRDSVGPRDVPVISAPAGTSVRIIRNAPFSPDESQRDAMRHQGEAILDTTDPGFVDTVVEEMNRISGEDHETKFRFSKFGGLASFLLSYDDTIAMQTSPVITLNMHGPDETEANPYVLLHEALHSADIISEPLIDLRKEGWYRHLLRYELRGFYVSAKVLELQENYSDLFRQYNTSYAGVTLIKRVEDTRSRHNDFLGMDMFEPTSAIDQDLRRHGIAILGDRLTPETILGQ